MPGLADYKAKTYVRINVVLPMFVTMPVAPSLMVFDLKSDKMSTMDSALIVMFVITLATQECAPSSDPP